MGFSNFSLSFRLQRVITFDCGNLLRVWTDLILYRRGSGLLGKLVFSSDYPLMEETTNSVVGEAIRYNQEILKHRGNLSYEFQLVFLHIYVFIIGVNF